MRAAVWMALAWCTTGCAATVVSLQVVNAERALEQAAARGAAQGAPFEYTMALRYLEKAREEVGVSELGAADALARQSEVWSERAVEFVDLGRRPGVQLDDLPDTLP